MNDPVGLWIKSCCIADGFPTFKSGYRKIIGTMGADKFSVGYQRNKYLRRIIMGFSKSRTQYPFGFMNNYKLLGMEKQH